jgi:hypothetical protein
MLFPLDWFSYAGWQSRGLRRGRRDTPGRERSKLVWCLTSTGKWRSHLILGLTASIALGQGERPQVIQATARLTFKQEARR